MCGACITHMQRGGHIQLSSQRVLQPQRSRLTSALTLFFASSSKAGSRNRVLDSLVYPVRCPCVRGGEQQAARCGSGRVTLSGSLLSGHGYTYPHPLLASLSKLSVSTVCCIVVWQWAMLMHLVPSHSTHALLHDNASRST